MFAVADWVSDKIVHNYVLGSSVGSGLASFSFSRKSPDGLKGHSFVVKNFGPATQLLCKRALAGCQRIEYGTTRLQSSVRVSPRRGLQQIQAAFQGNLTTEAP